MKYKEDAIARAYAIHNANRVKHSFVLSEISELTLEQCMYCIETAARIKKSPSTLLPLKIDRPILGLFQQTSTRTRASLDIAAQELRASLSYTEWRSTNFHLTSPVEEIKILSQLYAMIFIRMRDHALLKRMGAASAVPLINAMSSHEHPMQALSDAFTIKEFFQTDFQNLRLAYIGDANNVARSLAFLADTLKLSMVYSSPAQYRFSDSVPVQYEEDPRIAVKDADIVYTDTWVSIGDEAERDKRLAAFTGYQVNRDLFSYAPKHALIMHCLPAHLDEEISTEMYASPRAIHCEQALNKQYIAQSLMIYAIHEHGQIA